MTTGWSARLAAARAGDDAAFAEAFEAAYEELRRLALGAIFYVRKGSTLITLGSAATRELTIAFARRIVPRIK